MKEKNGLLSLDLSNKGIKQISEIEGLAGLTNLQVLSLKKNKIEKIEDLDTLKSLVRLDLGYNKITNIEGLGNLTKLEDLNLEYNDIKIIEGLDNLKELKKLKLFKNLHLSEIKSFQNKENLIELVLGGPLAALIKRNYRKVTVDSVIKYTQLSPQELNRNRERHLKVQKRKSNIIGISLIAIGSLIIIGGAVTYYIEKRSCPWELGCGSLTYWGGLGLFGLTFFASIFLIPGIIYPYRNRIKEGYDCCLMVLLPIPTTYFLAWLIITIL